MAKPADHEAIGDLIELAGIYFADGALRSAADRLRKAAEYCDQLANKKDAFVAGSVR